MPISTHLPLAVALTLTVGVALTVVAATEKVEKDEPTIFQTAQSKLAPFHSQILAERAKPSDSISVKHAAFAKKLVKKKKKSAISGNR